MDRYRKFNGLILLNFICFISFGYSVAVPYMVNEK